MTHPIQPTQARHVVATAIQAATAALGAHDAWHSDHDDNDGYPESDLQHQSVGARLGLLMALSLVGDAALAADELTQAETIEALRRGLCALPRYSFHLDQGGGVRRVNDRYGSWVEWQKAHELFDVVVVDDLVKRLRADAGKIISIDVRSLQPARPPSVVIDDRDTPLESDYQ